MEHALIEGFTRPKAKLDPIFQMKREIVKFCSRMAEIRKHNPKHLYILKNHITTDFTRAAISGTYYDFLETKEFDRKMYNALALEATSEINGYQLIHITEDFVERANRLRHRPHHPSPPFYIDERKIKTLYSNKFYARFELDCFDHLTMIIHHAGKEWYFAGMQQPQFGYYYPIWYQPFLSAKGLENHFKVYGTTFADSFVTMKGLFNAWFGYRF